jgi:hypothetical protein
MANYPRTQTKIGELANSMLSGFGEHPEFFPSVNPASLAAILAEYQQAASNLAEANAQAAVAAVKKKEKLAALQIATKSQIKIAQVDCVENPQRLDFIGWGQTAAPSAIPAPSQPIELVIGFQGFDGTIKKGIIKLTWRKPSNAQRKHISYYSVERRELAGGQDGWQQAATCIDDQIILKDQPPQVRLEYRVRAANKAGQSMPSNVVSAVL